MYIVHLIYDDRLRTRGTCYTDHPLARGEIFYGKLGRAIVRSCHHVTAK